MWFKNHLKSVCYVGKSSANRHFLCHSQVIRQIKGGTMKIALVALAGLTIGALITISAFQLLKVIFQEMLNMAAEAWYSPEQH